MEDLNSKRQGLTPKSGSAFRNRMTWIWGLVISLLLGFAIFLIISNGEKKVDDLANEAANTEMGESTAGDVIDGKDALTGLVLDEGFELVELNCTRCHSSAIILQSRFTREDWKSKIVWMQQTQGLWDLGANEPLILDYLAKNYGPEAPRGRRAPLKDIEWYELED
jgi:hypothetical protein